MSQTIRKNITIKEDAYNIINEYAKKQGISFSEMLWKSAIQKINNDEEMDLLSFMQENCKYVTEEEQIELDEMNVDFSDCSGKELSLDELL